MGTVAIVAMWFVCSVITEVYDKLIITQLGAPLTLALWKFMVSAPLGFVTMLALVKHRPPLSALFSCAVLLQVTPEKPKAAKEFLRLTAAAEREFFYQA